MWSFRCSDCSLNLFQSFPAVVMAQSLMTLGDYFITAVYSYARLSHGSQTLKTLNQISKSYHESTSLHQFHKEKVQSVPVMDSTLFQLDWKWDSIVKERLCPLSMWWKSGCLAAVFMLGPRGRSSLASLAFAAWSSFSPPPVLCTVFVWPFWLLLQALGNAEHLCTVVIAVSFQKLHSMCVCLCGSHLLWQEHWVQEFCDLINWILRGAISFGYDSVLSSFSPWALEKHNLKSSQWVDFHLCIKKPDGKDQKISEIWQEGFYAWLGKSWCIDKSKMWLSAMKTGFGNTWAWELNIHLR